VTPTEVQKTLTDVIVCAESWMADVRLLGNVRAGDIREACDRARAAVLFVEKYGANHVDYLDETDRMGVNLATAEDLLAKVLEPRT